MRKGISPGAGKAAASLCRHGGRGQVDKGRRDVPVAYRTRNAAGRRVYFHRPDPFGSTLAGSV